MRIKRIQSESDRRGSRYYEFDLDSQPMGRGGMGIVYRGEMVDEISGIRTEVAIKALHDELPPEVYERAKREASIKIRHNNLVEMYGLVTEYETDHFGIKQQHHYLISELLHGVDLSDMLKGRFINNDGTENDYARQLHQDYVNNREETAVFIIRNIVSGVLALHDMNYIHRDIDPSNIMVTSDGCIKLIDFGIAKNLNTLTTTDRLMTTAGVFIGKAEYASPELVLGDVKNQNYTTDIYAIGILLYRLLVGKLPFEGSQYDILQAQQRKKVPVANISSPALAGVVKKATAKSQKDRYGTTAELRVAIDEAVRKPGRRLPRLLAGAAAAVAILLAGWAVYKLLPAPPADDTQESAATDVNSVDARFEEALALLDNADADSVAKGLVEMKKLAAEEKYAPANIEVGLTYNPYPLHNPDTRTRLILDRRKSLGLTDNDRSEADSVMKYLGNAPYLPPEALYVLGVTQFKATKKTDAALPHFREAKRLIDRDVEVGHGYETHDLADRISLNIKALEELKH